MVQVDKGDKQVSQVEDEEQPRLVINEDRGTEYVDFTSGIEGVRSQIIIESIEKRTDGS